MKKALGRIYILIIMLFLYLPILTLIVLSFNDVKSMSVWGGFSLHWYAELFQSRLMMGAIVNTFSIAILASLIATIVGTLAVLGMAAMRPRWILEQVKSTRSARSCCPSSSRASCQDSC